MDSGEAGSLREGVDVDMLEKRQVKDGTTHVRFAKGWVSMTDKDDGAPLLESVGAEGRGVQERLSSLLKEMTDEDGTKLLEKESAEDRNVRERLSSLLKQAVQYAAQATDLQTEQKG